MAIKLKIPRAQNGSPSGKSRGRGRDPVVQMALLGFLSVSLVVIGFFAYWYVKYDRIIEQRFRGPVFASSAKIFASPHLVRVGTKMTVSEIAAELRHAGYSEKEDESLLGSYHLHGGSIEVLPGPSRITAPNQPPSPLRTERFRPSTAALPGTGGL